MKSCKEFGLAIKNCLHELLAFKEQDMGCPADEGIEASVADFKEDAHSSQRSRFYEFEHILNHPAMNLFPTLYQYYDESFAYSGLISMRADSKGA